MNWNPRLRRHLSAEYVLGTLRGAARRRFERFLPQDPLLQQEVQQWEHTLQRMTQLDPVAPPPEVWSAIQRAMQPMAVQMNPDLPPAPSLSPPIVHTPANDSFWKVWAGFSSTMALVLGIALYRAETRPLPEPEPMPYVSILQQEDAHWMVSLSPEKAQISVVLNGQSPQDRQHALELWVILPDGPHSLGLLPQDGEYRASLPLTLAQQVTSPDGKTQALTLAVSREPRGGSRTGKPTGPVVLKAPAMRVI